MEKCLECDRYKREIDNLQMGLRIAKDEARGAQRERPKGEMDDQFALILGLAHRLDEARKNYERHRNAHSNLN